MAGDGLVVMGGQVLHDIVDGRLDGAARLMRALGPQARARIHAYRVQNAGFATLYGPVAAEPVPPRLTALIDAASPATL